MTLLSVNGLGVRFEGRRGLFKRRGEIWALKQISFSFGALPQVDKNPPKGLGPLGIPEGAAPKGATLKGATLSIIGESGSGKTTLLRALLGLVKPAAGSVELWGKDMEALSGAERLAVRRRCGYVPQDPYGSLPPSLTVLEAVLEPWGIVKGFTGSARAEGEAKAKALLAELKLPEELWGARVRYALSGGQRQRVSVARALILDPELLFCDEPTAMQDVSTRGEVLEVLNRRIDSGMSMILVTHDLLLARYAAERGMVFRQGEVVESGKTSELLTNPAHEYTRALLAALPRI